MRDPEEIGCRIILLSAIVIWQDIETAEERRAWQRWLSDHQLNEDATPAEFEILVHDDPTSMSAAWMDVCERALDAIVPLAWATALTDLIAIAESRTAAADLPDSIPMPPERIEPFLDQLIIRDENEIALERERAELWNWRLAAEALRRQSLGRDRMEIDQAIAEVILESAVSLALDEIDLEDFLVDGVPVSALDEERLNAVTVASEERLRAFNWICGLTDWENVHAPE